MINSTTSGKRNPASFQCINKTGILIVFILTNLVIVKAQYISEVLEYKPAPGQFINSAPWGIPHSTSSILGGVTGSLSLGAFGGYVVFTFDEPVENHPDNPFGVDFTLFGNPLTDWSEPGIVSVMKDENENGLPDDTWYELAGSDYYFSTTIKNYEVTYINPDTNVAANVLWYDNQGDTGFIYSNPMHTQSYYPLVDSFSSIHNESYTLSGTCIQHNEDLSNPAFIKLYKRAFGYADNQLRGSAPYTLPDNPYTPEKENSGGDAFDIDWAVDEYGNYMDLDVIHFIKVHTGALAGAGWLGEVSTEITGAVDVAPNDIISGILDMIVIKELPDTIKESPYQIEAFAYYKGRRSQTETINWSSDLPEATVDKNNVLTYSKPGELTLTASLESNPEITASVSAVLTYCTNLSPVFLTDKPVPAIYPNPASDFITITGIENAAITIYNITGEKMMTINNYSNNDALNIKNLNKGIFLMHIKDRKINKTIRFIKL